MATILGEWHNQEIVAIVIFDLDRQITGGKKSN